MPVPLSSITSRKTRRKVNLHALPLIQSPHSLASTFLLLGSIPCLVSLSPADLPVVVRFKSIGAAPVMKNNVFKVTAGNRFQAVIVFLRSQLGLKQGDPLVRHPFAAHQVWGHRSNRTDVLYA